MTSFVYQPDYVSGLAAVDDMLDKAATTGITAGIGGALLPTLKPRMSGFPQFLSDMLKTRNTMSSVDNTFAEAITSLASGGYETSDYAPITPRTTVYAPTSAPYPLKGTRVKDVPFACVYRLHPTSFTQDVGTDATPTDTQWEWLQGGDSEFYVGTYAGTTSATIEDLGASKVFLDGEWRYDLSLNGTISVLSVKGPQNGYVPTPSGLDGDDRTFELNSSVPIKTKGLYSLTPMSSITSQIWTISDGGDRVSSTGTINVISEPVVLPLQEYGMMLVSSLNAGLPLAGLPGCGTLSSATASYGWQLRAWCLAYCQATAMAKIQGSIVA